MSENLCPNCNAKIVPGSSTCKVCYLPVPKEDSGKPLDQPDSDVRVSPPKDSGDLANNPGLVLDDPPDNSDWGPEVELSGESDSDFEFELEGVGVDDDIFQRLSDLEKAMDVIVTKTLELLQDGQRNVLQELNRQRDALGSAHQRLDCLEGDMFTPLESKMPKINAAATLAIGFVTVPVCGLMGLFLWLLFQSNPEGFGRNICIAFLAVFLLAIGFYAEKTASRNSSSEK